MKVHKEVILTILITLYIPWVTNQPLSLLRYIEKIPSWGQEFWDSFKAGIMKSGESKIMRICSASKPFKDSEFTTRMGAAPEFSRQVSYIRKVINTRLENITGLISVLEEAIDNDDRIFHLKEKMGFIEDRYNDFEKELAMRELTFTEGNLCFFATHILQGSGLSSVVDEMHNIVVPSASLQPTLLAPIVEALKEQQTSVCGEGHSLFDSLHSLYTGLFTVEIKAFLLEAFAHQFLSSYKETGISCKYLGTNAETAVKMAYDKLLRHLRAYNRVFTLAMTKAPRAFRACDHGEGFIRDVSVLELEGAFQMVLQVYVNSTDFLATFCKSIDTVLIDALSIHYVPFCNLDTKFCLLLKNRPCNGHIWQCENSNIVQACIDEKGPRRYQWMSSSGDNERYSKCKFNSRVDLTSSDSCLCRCMENSIHSTSTHLINLQPVESDVAENMVITGIRFVVKHRILQFQIQQGKLGINWRVENTSWKPVNDIGKQIRAVRLNRSIRGESHQVKENEDFLIIEIGKNNKINFDELYVPSKYVLTGVRFMIANKSEGSVERIEISLIATKFDYITGKLCLKCEKEIIKSKVIHNREYLISGNPVTAKFSTIPDSYPDQYITIQTSDLNIDGGQTTLPLFDAVPLVTDPPSPVGGLGLFYKKAENFAGLVSLQFISLDYIDSINDSEREIDTLFNITAKGYHLSKFNNNRSL